MIRHGASQPPPFHFCSSHLSLFQGPRQLFGFLKFIGMALRSVCVLGERRGGERWGEERERRRRGERWGRGGETEERGADTTGYLPNVRESDSLCNAVFVDVNT